MKLFTPTISIVIPVYKTEQYLDKVLAAIDDQDYKKVEKIIVVNKDNKEIVKKFDQSKKGDVLLVTIDEDKGAPYARNIGAKEATGEILLFVDSDTYLNPGILRLYVEAFRDNPDVDFVYTKYEIVAPQGEQPLIVGDDAFDEYKLTCNNYITGTSPMKTKAFPGWDESVKSLQDWDMWLTMVQSGSKGFFIEDIVGFKTEPVRKGSVSWDSYKNWIKRRNVIREKHGIPNRKVAVISMGAPQHALATAKILQADYYRAPIHKENEYDLVYLLGFYPQGAKAHVAALTQHINKKTKRIVHWIGTDVFQMHHQTSWAGLKDLKRMFKELKIKHFSEYQLTHDELKELGIKSEIIPLPPEKIFTPTPLPKKFSVGIYINPTQDMYYEDHMYDIARAMPDVHFKFFGNKDKVGRKEDNIEWVGYVNMDKFIDETSCNLRITKHDGLPLTPVQFFLKGRDVVTSTPLDYAYMIDLTKGDITKQQIVKSIRTIQKKNKLNKKASKHYTDLMSHEKFQKRIKEELSSKK